MTSRVAVVTGAGGALGSAICHELIGRGNKVVVAYNQNKAAADRLVQALGSNSRAVACDLSSADAPRKILEFAIETFGQVGILVNNAGVMTESDVASMTDEQWDQSLAINLTAAFRLTREVIPGMKAAHWGRLLNVSSQAAFAGSIGRAHYAAAKAGLLGLTYSLALELGSFGITANAVVPGRFRSDMLAEHTHDKESKWIESTPVGRLGDPKELASLVGYVTSHEAAYVTGAAIHINGGIRMG